MDALKEHFKDNLDETFVWTDFAIVDQHKAATLNIDFHEWSKTFRESLMKIGQAVLVQLLENKQLRFQDHGAASMDNHGSIKYSIFILCSRSR